jgi:hypothetical protein
LIVGLEDTKAVDPAERAEQAAGSSKETQPRFFATIRKLAWVKRADGSGCSWLSLLFYERWLLDVGVLG